jgi:hypothetical protein
MTETGYTKTIKPVRDWSQRIWRLMFTQQVEIARGRVDGSQSVAVTGTLTTSGAVTDIMIWPGSTVKDPSVAPAGGVQMTLVSTSAQDSAAGTGVRTLRFNYLDADLNPQSEIVTMNGTTPVLTTATNVRWVGDLTGLTFGSEKHVVGNITVTNSGTRYKYLDAEARGTRSTAFRVPAGKRLIVHSLFAGANSGSAGANVQISFVASVIGNLDGSVDRFEDVGLLFRQGTVELQDNTTALADGALAAFPAGAIIGFRVTTDKRATTSAGFYGWIEDAD